MNRKLLFTLAAGFSLTTIMATTPHNLNKVSKISKMPRANTMRADQEFSLQSYNLNPNVQAAPMQLPTGSISLVEMGSSPNLYTALVSESHCLTADQNLNLIAFNRRRNQGDFGNTGFVQTSFSLNAGASFDSSLTVMGDSTDAHLGRYPTGAILNPAGNKNPMNAFLVSSGPWHPGANWQGNFFASRKVDGSNYSVHFQDNLNLGANEISSDFARIGSQATDDEVFHVAAGSYLNANGTTAAAQGYKYAVLHSGKLNHTTNSLDWTSRAFPHTFRTDPTDNSKVVSSQAYTAWSQDGQVGYVIYFGEDSLTFDTLKSFQPIIYKTTDFGVNWNFMPMQDFSQVSALTSVIRSTRQGTKRPFFSSVNGVSTTVDVNKNLHIISTIKAASTNHPDSLEFTWSIPNILADVHTTNNGSWDAIVIDTLLTDTVSVADSPWQASDNSGGNGWDARVQVSRTQDGKKLFYGWMDTDSTWGASITSNLFPDIYAKGYDVITGQKTATRNFTSSDDALHGKIQWMFMQSITLMDTATSSYNLGFSTTNSYDGSFDALSAVKHFYVKGVRFSQPDFTGTADCSTFSVSDVNVVVPTGAATSDGSAVVTISGGVSPFTYSWSNNISSTTSAASGLNNGNYEVTVVDALGCVTGALVKISNVDVAKLNKSEFVQLYPNPTTGIVNIVTENSVASNVKVSVVSIDGSVVLSKNFDSSTIKTIDLSGVSKGLYFVKVTAGSKINITKITKM